MNNKFYKYVQDFISDYLPKVRMLSESTINTYNDSLIVLLRYFEEKQNIKSDKIMLDLFNVALVEDYIKWLSEEKDCSNITINVRLAALKNFFEFVSKREIKYAGFYNQLKSMRSLKSQKKIIKYLSDEEIKILLSIKSESNTDIKHLTMLYLLYDSAIRVQELCDLTYQDINFKENYITVKHGKGNKSRLVPITKELVSSLTNYCKIFNCENQLFLFENQSQNRYTRWGVQCIINKYIKIAKLQHPDLFIIKVTPHTFRHSKAMSLLEHGVALTTIEQLLGHSSISTTEVYARASNKSVRDALEENKIDIKAKKRYSTKKEENLENWLKSHKF